MRTHLLFAITVSALGTLAVSASAQGQSLADVARQEEARRKAVQPAVKVYTNESLRADGATATPSASTVSTPAAPAAQPGAPAADAKPAADEPKKDERYWRQRLTEERDKLSRAETFAEALQSRINALTTDFAARDDPFQRNQVSNDRQKALNELDRVRQEIAAHTKAVADIQEEGRKAGAPAGWLR
jgi:hypothetical protein